MIFCKFCLFPVGGVLIQLNMTSMSDMPKSGMIIDIICKELILCTLFAKEFRLLKETTPSNQTV